MLFRRIIAAILLVAAVLLGAPALAGSSSLAGYWYGTGYQPASGEDDEFIAHHLADGTFAIHFRTYHGCTVVSDQTEAGTWSMPDATTVQIVTTQVNGKAAGPYTDDYRVVELTGDIYRYVHIESGVPYSSHRVDADFDFPNCGLTS